MKQNKKIMDNIEKNVCANRVFELANRNKTERLKLIIQFVVSIVVVLSLNNNLFEIDKSPPSSVIIRTWKTGIKRETIKVKVTITGIVYIFFKVFI